MYVLYAENPAELAVKARLFNQHMEPLLERLKTFAANGTLPADIREFRDYLQVCRWPFRQLEYSFALEALLNHLKPGDRYLDAGCGVTPLAHVVAGGGVQAEACDGDRREIEALRDLKPEKIYGSFVSFSTQDLTQLDFPNESFDAISCISVLEHIPAPYDQQSLRELWRVLKPGGLIVLTVDFIPGDAAGYHQYWRRFQSLLRGGRLVEVGQALRRRIAAREVVNRGGARQARTANQSFQVTHLEQDLLPVLQGDPVPSGLGFSTELRAFTQEHARRLWSLQPDLRHISDYRPILPAALGLRKVTAAVAA
ncbi:MAG: class I SAM-dependent methyltransferase [Anaerolineales bacterium]